MSTVMDLQTSIVVLLVPACAGYAAWKLAPAALKRGAARRLLHVPLPAPFVRALQRAARAGGGCACDGCDAAPPRPDAAPVTLHRRPPAR